MTYLQIEFEQHQKITRTAATASMAPMKAVMRRLDYGLERLGDLFGQLELRVALRTCETFRELAAFGEATK